ncbi:hypothetical protein JKP88DRAFT_305123 [Tribonema minus]|uniref:BHLH domain-containing protein n=1 Tax=Tribonema minus TaxID=303371 RepID=A0A836CIX2_9STRA|nr:hypothetical protein JKP88DRAFT_305123 [Tribonema minus]
MRHAQQPSALLLSQLFAPLYSSLDTSEGCVQLQQPEIPDLTLPEFAAGPSLTVPYPMPPFTAGLIGDGVLSRPQFRSSDTGWPAVTAARGFGSSWHNNASSSGSDSPVPAAAARFSDRRQRSPTPPRTTAAFAALLRSMQQQQQQQHAEMPELGSAGDASVDSDDGYASDFGGGGARGHRRGGAGGSGGSGSGGGGGARAHRNAREQVRSAQISEQIAALRAALAGAGVSAQSSRHGLLADVAAYIHALQRRTRALEDERQRWLAENPPANSLLSAGGCGGSSEGRGGGEGGGAKATELGVSAAAAGAMAFQAIFSQAAVGIATADATGRLGECNARFEEASAFTRAELRSHTLRTLAAPAYLPRIAKLLRAVAAAAAAAPAPPADSGGSSSGGSSSGGSSSDGSGGGSSGGGSPPPPDVHIEMDRKGGGRVAVTLVAVTDSRGRPAYIQCLVRPGAVAAAAAAVAPLPSPQWGCLGGVLLQGGVAGGRGEQGPLLAAGGMPVTAGGQ